VSSPSRGTTGEISSSSWGGVTDRDVGGRAGGEIDRLARDRCRFALRALLGGGRKDGEGGALDIAYGWTSREEEEVIERGRRVYMEGWGQR
jgi:hypothetical protein